MNPNRTPLLAANWKQNQLWEDCEHFIEALSEHLPGVFAGNGSLNVELLICPPFPYLNLIGTLIENSQLYLGAQDVSRHGGGAYTGEISAAMLSDLGCDFCIVGHSERRTLMGDTDQAVAEKLIRLREAEIVPVLCVGEGLPIREAGRAVPHVLAQLDAVAAELERLAADGLVIAYEPIWAIGTGRNALPEDAQEMAGAIREWAVRRLGDELAEQLPVLYGGSVKPDNLEHYLAQPDIDGALIGGASLKADQFAAMARLITG